MPEQKNTQPLIALTGARTVEILQQALVAYAKEGWKPMGQIIRVPIVNGLARKVDEVAVCYVAYAPALPENISDENLS